MTARIVRVSVPLPHGRLIPAPGLILLVILTERDNYDIAVTTSYRVIETSKYLISDTI